MLPIESPPLAQQSLTPAVPAQPNSLGRFALHTLKSTKRIELEGFIHAGFKKAYGANIQTYLPLLLELCDELQTQSVIGLKPACCGELFVEQYLDAPIEQAIAGALQTPIDRDGIVEIGNLVSSRKGLSPILFLVMSVALAKANYRWLAFTATPQVRKLIQRLSVAPTPLTYANPARLKATAGSWGSYYQTLPEVMVLDLHSAMNIANQSPLVQHLMQQASPAIDILAQQLRDHRRICGLSDV